MIINYDYFLRVSIFYKIFNGRVMILPEIYLSGNVKIFNTFGSFMPFIFIATFVTFNKKRSF